ncbi:MAG: hypothetical protein QW318_08740 [Candidatus Caldarchaeum sp.]
MFKFEGPAETLHYHIREKAAELGLPKRGGFANAVVFSPPYCNMLKSPRKDLRGFSKDDMRTFTKSSYRAFVTQLVASAYLMLRVYGRCVVVVKDVVSTGLGRQVQDIVAEAMGFVGFKKVKVHTFLIEKPSAYVEWHRSQGHRYEHLLYEYVVEGQKTAEVKPRQAIKTEVEGSE